MTNMLKLYSYWRSSTSYKVRIALNIKKLNYDILPIHLVKNGGAQKDIEYKKLNPMQAVPVLVDGSFTVTQSNAILEYLEDRYPMISLLPPTLRARAKVREIMNIIACDIHPLNNLRVLQTLSQDININEDAKKNWYHKWINQGFESLEIMINTSNLHTGTFAIGDTPSYADCSLIPQIYNARRYGVDMTAYPTLTSIEQHCVTLEPFIGAHPTQQPDAEPET